MSDKVNGPRALSYDLWAHVLSFLDKKGEGRMVRTCKLLKQVVDEEKELRNAAVQKHPYLKFLIDHSSRIQSGLSYRQKLPRLNSYVSFAKIVGDILKGKTHDGRFVSESFSRDVEILRDRYEQRQQIRIARLSNLDPVRDLAQRSNLVSFDALFLTSVLLKDNGFLKSISPEIIGLEVIDFAAYFYLLQGRIDLFKEMLPLVLREEARGHNRKEKLTKFLILAAEKNELRVFQDLLQWNCPYDANKVLVKLAEQNRGEAITQLLASVPTRIDREFIPGNERNEAHTHTNGLHSALMFAMNLNSQAAIDAILQGSPVLDRRILEHVRNLARNHPGPEGFRQPFIIGEWRQRDNNPRLREIADQLDAEILRRFGEVPAEPPQEEILGNGEPLQEVFHEQVPLDHAAEPPPEQPAVPPLIPVAQNGHRRGMALSLSIALLSVLGSACHYWLSSSRE